MAEDLMLCPRITRRPGGRLHVEASEGVRHRSATGWNSARAHLRRLGCRSGRCRRVEEVFNCAYYPLGEKRECSAHRPVRKPGPVRLQELESLPGLEPLSRANQAAVFFGRLAPSAAV